MKIYCARPFTGCTYKHVDQYYNILYKYLHPMGYSMLYSMMCKDGGELDKKNKFTPKSLGSSAFATNHAIVERDKWLINKADVVLVDLSATKRVSIGSMMELAWATYINKHTIVVMEKDNIHQHAFVAESADVITQTLDEALKYLEQLCKYAGVWDEPRRSN